MSDTPFTAVGESVNIPNGLSSDAFTATEQVWDVVAEYFNSGMPAQLVAINIIGGLIAGIVG